MGKIYAGTSGWAYTSWKPKFYPRKLGASRYLNYYATRLNSVEVNHTFSKDVSAELLRGWVADTPEDFVFAVKAHRRITHLKRLRGEALPATADFLQSLEPLRQENKLGPVLFQLPPNFKCDVSRLREFLAVLPRGLRVAFEFRHESWFVDEIYAVLRSAGMALCQAESEKIVTPSVATADFHYLRLRKASYTAKPVAQKVRRLAQSGDVFVYFKHEDTPQGALNAEIVLALTRKK
jgi:uncharacterized protein YecE (DUF72 family)